MMGMTGEHNGVGFDNIVYMPCRPENNFFPDLSKVRVCMPACMHAVSREFPRPAPPRTPRCAHANTARSARAAVTGHRALASMTS